MDGFAALVIALAGYLLGSLSPGYFWTKKETGKDIRGIESGSTGATNVSRVIGKQKALLVGTFDFLKGAVPAFLVLVFWRADITILALPAIVAGHVFPFYLNFKGGKGVAATMGVTFFLLLDALIRHPNPMLWVPVSVVIIIGSWLGTYIYGGRRVSLASVALMVSLLILFLLLKFPVYTLTVFAMTTLVIFAHRENIIRIWQGRERKTK
ncbi:MAG: glycerol-3-phosphate acyltransferase [Patescibacteria group bacterium]